MTKRALIIGSRGQDGRLLTDLLIGKKYAVLGIDRGGTTLAGAPADPWPAVDILRPGEVSGAVERFRPDEVYFFAAHQR